MFAALFRQSCGLVPVLVVVVAVGCAKKGSTVAGNVTYDGEPVRAGHISFIPEDGLGKTVGANIREGRYKALDVPPGKKRVMIVSGDPNAPGSRDSGEEPGKVGPEHIAKQREDLIPPDAGGNNALVDVAGKAETLNFDLEKPKRDRQPTAPGFPGGAGRVPNTPPGVPK